MADLSTLGLDDQIAGSVSSDASGAFESQPCRLWIGSGRRDESYSISLLLP